MRHLKKRLYYKNPNDIMFDDKNPRGESESQIISDPEFKKLASSIRDFGVLEPIIVRNTSSSSNIFALVDGERRLRAAREVKEPEIPVLIAKDETDGRILAYQVHKLRKDWTPAAETKSIKRIISDIKENFPDITEQGLKKKIRELTQIKSHSLDDILRLIKYDDSIIDKVIADKTGHSYLVQIESSFVNKVKRCYPKILDKYDENAIRHILAKKALQGLLGNARYLMDRFKVVFEDKDKKEEVQQILLNFLKYKSKKIETALAEYQKLSITEDKRQKRKKKKTKKKKKKEDIKSTPVPVEIDHKTTLRVAEVEIINNHVFDLMFNNLKDAVLEFERRTNTKFKNELELQNFIYSMLRTLFESTEFEDPTEKICGASNRLDFVLKDHKIIIEVKYVRDRNHAKKISKELSEDYPRYKLSKYGEKIINYIYDPNNYIANHNLFKRQLKLLLQDANHYIQ